MAVTFLLFNRPEMQLYLMIHASLLYIFYICNYPLYRDQALRRHELANEVVVMLIYYHLALLSNVAWEPEIKRVLGHSLTGSVLLLVLGNGVFMSMLNLKGLLRAKKLRRVKAQRDEIKREREAALGVLRCAGVLNEIIDEEVDRVDL